MRGPVSQEGQQALGLSFGFSFVLRETRLVCAGRRRGARSEIKFPHIFDDFTRFSMAPKGLWRRPRTFEGGPLEPLKGPGDLERPPGIILTSPPSPPAAGCGAPLRRFGHRPPLAGRQAGGREPREEPQEKPGGPGKGKKTTGVLYEGGSYVGIYFSREAHSPWKAPEII